MSRQSGLRLERQSPATSYCHRCLETTQDLRLHQDGCAGILFWSFGWVVGAIAVAAGRTPPAPIEFSVVIAWGWTEYPLNRSLYNGQSLFELGAPRQCDQAPGAAGLDGDVPIVGTNAEEELRVLTPQPRFELFLEVHDVHRCRSPALRRAALGRESFRRARLRARAPAASFGT